MDNDAMKLKSMSDIPYDIRQQALDDCERTCARGNSFICNAAANTEWSPYQQSVARAAFGFTLGPVSSAFSHGSPFEEFMVVQQAIIAAFARMYALGIVQGRPQ